MITKAEPKGSAFWLLLRLLPACRFAVMNTNGVQLLLSFRRERANLLEKGFLLR